MGFPDRLATFVKWAMVTPCNPTAFPPSMAVMPACAGTMGFDAYHFIRHSGVGRNPLQR